MPQGVLRKIYLETTTRCNLHCRMCLKYAQGNCIEVGDLDLATMSTQAREARERNISLHLPHLLQPVIGRADALEELWQQLLLLLDRLFRPLPRPGHRQHIATLLAAILTAVFCANQ